MTPTHRSLHWSATIGHEATSWRGLKADNRIPAQSTGGQYGLYSVTLARAFTATLPAAGVDAGLFVIAGGLALQLESRRQVLQRGDFLHLPAGTPAQFTAAPDEPTLILVIEAPPGDVATDLFTVTRREGLVVGAMGDAYRLIATGEQTAGRYTLVEAMVGPGGGPPLHVHSREDEGFYVLEGAITFYDMHQPHPARAGTCLNLPIGLPHRFANEGDAPARMLIIAAPSGFDRMIVAIGHPIASLSTPVPPPTPAEIHNVVTLCSQFGVNILSPA